MSAVFVTGSFDNLRSSQVRFLEEAARLGAVHVLLLSDRAAAAVEGKTPRFPQAERLYLLEALRYTNRVTLVDDAAQTVPFLPAQTGRDPLLAVCEGEDAPVVRAFCQARGIRLAAIPRAQMRGFPAPRLSAAPTGRKKVLVTGCYDWLHSGHVRFFEEASQLGDLYVVVGSDANVRLLKGEGHPLFGQDERRYMVQAVRHVRAALVSTGSGWMDAGPEIERIRPDIYLVNEDGDRPEKRAFCRQRGLEYVVLKRAPREGLPRRESTNLRGF